MYRRVEGRRQREGVERTGDSGDGGGRRLSGRINAQPTQPPSTSGNAVTWGITFCAGWVLIVHVMIIAPQERSSMYVKSIRTI
jgi:hypothetical protein